ncbi:uncharacterized protein LOC123893256 [Trifolium pratense]|nr:uncharacterized protein LOC123893256 [Trifolium pratense]
MMEIELGSGWIAHQHCKDRKVQSVLLLLGGREIPPTVPSMPLTKITGMLTNTLTSRQLIWWRDILKIGGEDNDDGWFIDNVCNVLGVGTIDGWVQFASRILILVCLAKLQTQGPLRG